MVFKVLKAGTKLGLAGGAIYWSVQQGVWGRPQEGAHAMKRFLTTIFPDEDLAAASVPKPQRMVNIADEGIIRSSWNRGTKTVFEYIRDVPEHAGNATATVTNFIKDSFKS